MGRKKLVQKTSAKSVVQSTTAPIDTPAPRGASESSPLAPNLPKRKPGRPVGSGKKPLDVRVKESMAKLITDAEPLMAPVNEDGGGTPITSPNVTRESLERRVARRLNVLDRYLTDQKLHELLVMSSLKEIGVFEAILMDKALVLKGQPNVIIGNDERVKLNEVLPALLKEMHRRKLIATASERKIEFRGADETNGPGG